ncbi:hypothetical protein [Paenibacillus radicis (ex Xue et al. 2023)]|uniref:Phosphohydrolase n=1 Tax=Paenibacillus radicis (ex Xue et al. 2023) TaxID=2972489 RepID=A0ABT1YER6_9BACL|nr:hypothetical protein [Paenibacillus radicis (ex Xue et al. 2023)]MCR8631687.1 hypothetical protein [Paenibacillus radicis (ex Xue et al. 2023)]
MVNDINFIEFVKPFYEKKDIMHDLSHIDRMMNSAQRLLIHYPEITDHELIRYGCYFHGFIYLEEQLIRDYLYQQGLKEPYVEKIIRISWESQKDEVPESLEGKLLHDAHMIEGGKTYLIVKSLCTGTARGQSLEQTLEYFETNVLGKGACYLPEAQPLYKEMQQFARDFINDLRQGLHGV